MTSTSPIKAWLPNLKPCAWARRAAPAFKGPGFSRAYIAGIATTQVTGSAVYITSQGQLGVLASAERFKTEIAPMGEASDQIAALRPVTFKLRTDPKRTVQYGLIAEEVAKVYPELVIRGADGRIDGVRYEELPPMLLNVVQKELRTQAQQAARIASQDRTIERLSAELRAMHAELDSLRVAQRADRSGQD